ncbi:MAG: LuxR C-terminal-related transcriptional regulator [Terriglobia bacterium]
MNVAIFSRYFLTRKSICSLLSPLRDVQIVLDSESVLESIDQVRATNPDILLLDSENLNDDVGIVRQVTKIFPLVKIVLLVGVEGAEFELRAIEAGARGCVSKRSDLPTLLKALSLIKQGQFWISREVASLLAGKLRGTVTPDHDASRELTEREWEILALLGIGYVNKDIANHLSISENTVKTHLASIYRKLQVNTRLGAVLHYFRRNQQLSGLTPSATDSEKGHAAMVETAPEDPDPLPRAPNQGLPLKVKSHRA